MARFQLMLGLVAVGTIAGFAHADTVWSQPGGASGIAYGFYSQNQPVYGWSTTIMADSFHLAAGTELTSATWWGFEGLNSSSPLGFALMIIADSAGLPDGGGALFSTYYTLAETSPTPDSTVNKYQVALPDLASLELPSGDYWIAIQADLPNVGDSWGWQTTAAGDSDDFFAYSGNGGAWTGFPGWDSLAFEINGNLITSIPLPPAVWLGAIGLGGAVVARRRALRR